MYLHKLLIYGPCTRFSWTKRVTKRSCSYEKHLLKSCFNSGATVQTVSSSLSAVVRSIQACLHEIHMFWRMNTHTQGLFSFYLNRTALKINGLLLSWGTNGSAWPASVLHCCWTRTKDPQAALPRTAFCSQHRPLTPMLSCYIHTPQQNTNKAAAVSSIDFMPLSRGQWLHFEKLKTEHGFYS